MKTTTTSVACWSFRLRDADESWGAQTTRPSVSFDPKKRHTRQAVYSTFICRSIQSKKANLATSRSVAFFCHQAPRMYGIPWWRMLWYITQDDAHASWRFSQDDFSPKHGRGGERAHAATKKMVGGFGNIWSTYFHTIMRDARRSALTLSPPRCRKKKKKQLWNKCVLDPRGAIRNRTYGGHKNLPGIHFTIFTNNTWSYLLWSPPIGNNTNKTHGFTVNSYDTIPGKVLLRAGYSTCEVRSQNTRQLRGTIVNRAKYCLVKVVKYIGFYVYHRSYQVLTMVLRNSNYLFILCFWINHIGGVDGPTWHRMRCLFATMPTSALAEAVSPSGVDFFYLSAGPHDRGVILRWKGPLLQLDSFRFQPFQLSHATYVRTVNSNCSHYY